MPHAKKQNYILEEILKVGLITLLDVSVIRYLLNLVRGLGCDMESSLLCPVGF